jgi:hypothetical protein
MSLTADPLPLPPFNTRTDISADAYHIAAVFAQSSRDNAREASGRIVKHLWIIFVLVPVVSFIVFDIATH